MARSGRFGKYGDLKRKELIRSTRVARTGYAKETLSSAGTVSENRPVKGHKKK